MAEDSGGRPPAGQPIRPDLSGDRDWALDVGPDTTPGPGIGQRAAEALSRSFKRYRGGA